METKQRKIFTLTLCPAFDVHLSLDEFLPERENLAALGAEDAGGKGVNISRALYSMGMASVAVIALGEASAERYLGALGLEGEMLRTLRVPGRIRENITLHPARGRETRVSLPGFSAPPSFLSQVASCLSDLKAGDVLTVTGRNPEGVCMEEMKQMLREEMARGVRLVIDSRSFSLSDLCDLRPRLIKPNEEEIAAYTGREVRTLADAASEAEALRRAGIENVMISLGALGSVLACPTGVYTCAAPRLSPVSTVGAGDSSIAGFLYAEGQGLPAPQCLRHAVAFGSAACLTEGTEPPARKDIERFLAQITVNANNN